MPQPQISTTIEELASRIGAKLQGKAYRCKCPVHGGASDNSLSLTKGTDGSIVVKCFGQCTTEQIKRAIGIWVPSSSKPVAMPSRNSDWLDKRIITEYHYEYLSGDPAFMVQRTDYPDKPKRFAQQLPDGSWKGLPSGRPLYHAVRVHEESDKDVLIVEGEKTVAAAQAIFPDLVVTTSAGGSRVAKLTDFSVLRGRNVTIWGDHDEPGRAYAQDVAAFCNDTKATTVRIVKMPEGTPEKWDLADDPGGLDLRKIYESAKAQGRLLTLTAQDLIAEPDQEHDWIVDGMLTMPGTSILVGSPKAGKSTLARRLAVAVAVGRSWLGMDTTKASVLLVAIDENRNLVKRDLRRLAPFLGTGKMDVLTRDSKPDNEDRLPMLREYIARTRPKLVIIDTVGRWIENFDEFRYAEVGNVMQPFSDIADEFGCHVLLTHHSRKGGTGQIEDALGSQSFSGGVDTVMLTWRTPAEAYRFRAIGRADVDFKLTGLKMDDSGWVELDASDFKAKADAQSEELIEHVLAGQDTQAKLLASTSMSKPVLLRALNSALAAGTLSSLGAGVKGNPLRYRVELV